VLVQFSDVTQRRGAERELARLNAELDNRVRERTAELQTTVQELEAFSYSVAHDLRAPLRAVNAYLQLAGEPGMEPALAREYRQKAASSVEGLSRLIDDLLEFARAGRRALERRLVDMNRLARDVAEPLQALHPDAEVVIRPLPPVAGDGFLLRQALHNLVENALKFSAGVASPRVEIFAEESDRHYVYRVRDNGVGFDMKYSANVFGVFQRLHDARDFAGTGVGLAIVKRIVERHQGRVWCDSRPGEGATFSFSLSPPDPRAAAPAADAPAEHGNPAR
jgi:light-regulated signal transduction histidine kinase (bacteriophytochrome)